MNAVGDRVQQVLAVQANHPLTVIHMQINAGVQLLELPVEPDVVVRVIFFVPVGVIDARFKIVTICR